MIDTVVLVICVVAGSFFGQLAANLLFPAVTRDEKEAQLAWMKCQEDINRILRERVERLEAYAGLAEVRVKEASPSSSYSIQPRGLFGKGTK